MTSSSLNNKFLNARKFLPFVSIALVTLLGMLLRPLTTISLLALALVYATTAFFFIKRKILDVRVAFALCGVGFALVLGILSEALAKTLQWQHSFFAISVAYGFAALIVAEGFLKEFAWITAGFRVSKRSRVIALFLTSSIAFLVNAIIMSAGSTCAVVAPIFVPLLIRLGFPAPVAAGAVVLGAWGGFVNPADTGGLAIAEAYNSNDLTMYSIPLKHIGPALMALIVANITFAAMTWKENHFTDSVDAGTAGQHHRNRRLHGLIVILPFLVFFPLEFLAWYFRWHNNVETRLFVCLAVASIIAAVVVLRNSEQRGKKVLPMGKVFFGGMWKGFGEVVLLIIAAKLFIAPFRHMIVTNGEEALKAAPMLAFVSVPTAFLASAAIGSGDALASSLIPAVVALIKNSTVYTGIVASMLWLATEMGRNVSPISAATLTSAKAVTSTEIEATTVSHHVWRPLLAGFVAGCLGLYLAFDYHRLAQAPMTVQNEKIEQLFSYGTLQTEPVQLAVFRRPLKGTPDTLPGYKVVMTATEDQEFIKKTGAVQHRSLQFTGIASDIVEGTVLTVTPEELDQSDTYEPADYERVRVKLKSGSDAWVYRNRRQ